MQRNDGLCPSKHGALNSNFQTHKGEKNVCNAFRCPSIDREIKQLAWVRPTLVSEEQPDLVMDGH